MAKKLNIDHKFYKKLLLLAVPITLQHFLNSLVHMVDTIMVGSLGEQSLAAVGAGNKLVFILILISYGISSGAAVFIAQYYGAGDMKSIRKIAALGIGIASTAGIIAFTIGFFANSTFMSVFTPDAEVQVIGQSYMRIVCFSYLITAIGFVLNFTLRSCRRVMLPVIASIISIGLNILLNWILIYGKFGFPEMGIRGAALATVIAKTLEFLIVIGNIYFRDTLKGFRIRLADFRAINKATMKMFFGRALPVMGNEFMWGLGTSMFFVIYGHMGTRALATMTVIQSIEEMAQALLLGTASASAVILGNEFGKSNLDRVKRYSISFRRVAVCIGLMIGMTIALSSNQIILLYDVKPEFANSVRYGIFVLAGYLGFRALNLTYIEGIFRSGGDTRYILKVDMGVVWMVGIPMALIAGLWLALPIHIVYGMVLAMELVKITLNTKRYASNKWMNILVTEQ